MTEHQKVLSISDMVRICFTNIVKAAEWSLCEWERGRPRGKEPLKVTYKKMR